MTMPMQETTVDTWTEGLEEITPALFVEDARWSRKYRAPAFDPCRSMINAQHRGSAALFRLTREEKTIADARPLLFAGDAERWTRSFKAPKLEKLLTADDFSQLVRLTKEERAHLAARPIALDRSNVEPGRALSFKMLREYNFRNQEG